MFNRNWTVADAARNCVKMFSPELQDFSFLSRLSNFHIDFERGIYQSGDDGGDHEVSQLTQMSEEEGLSVRIRSSMLRVVQREPWLSNCKYFHLIF
jgi:hypothetical protein